MSKISISNKLFLESILQLTSGFVLDFTNNGFQSFFADLDIDIYDDEKYPGNGSSSSKANRLRALLKSGSDDEVHKALTALADYITVKKITPVEWGDVPFQDITEIQISKIREIAETVKSDGSNNTSDVKPIIKEPTNAASTEAIVDENKIQIEIHEEIYNHIESYLRTGDYFHAVEESYKLVRSKLKEITGKEKAHEAFSEANFEKIFGHLPVDDVEKDFFEGVKFLNMSIQFLRNEKAHTPATKVEENLAIHYISLASLSYDLITKNLDVEKISQIEIAIENKRREYKTVNSFYADFANGEWIDGFKKQFGFTSNFRNKLKKKWFEELNFSISYDRTNIELMKLQLVIDDLSQEEIESLLDLPTKDKYGNEQGAGLLEFLKYIQSKHSTKITQKLREWINNTDK